VGTRSRRSKWIECYAHTAFPIIGIRHSIPDAAFVRYRQAPSRQRTHTRVQVGSIRCAHHVGLAHQHSARRSPSGHQRRVVDGAVLLQHDGACSGAHARRAKVVLHGQGDAVKRPQRLRRAAAGETGQLWLTNIRHAVYLPVRRAAWDVWMRILFWKRGAPGAASSCHALLL
jgi:hypothetical protein